MCECLPVPRLSSLASLVVSWLPFADSNPVPGTLSSLWSSEEKSSYCRSREGNCGWARTKYSEGHDGVEHNKKAREGWEPAVLHEVFALYNVE